MIEIEDMSDSGIESVLASVGYGHLACARNNEPYVVPIHYAYAKPHIYIYTTMGKKTEIIADNPKICLQVEKVADIRSWQSVIVYGTAEELADEPARAEALKAIVAVNPTLTPAVSIRWMDSWVRENIEVIYRVTPSLMTGRATVKRPEMRAAIIPGEKQRRGDVQ